MSDWDQKKIMQLHAEFKGILLETKSCVKILFRVENGFQSTDPCTNSTIFFNVRENQALLSTFDI